MANTQTVSADQIISALQWRYATKKYDTTKKISDKDWQVLKESLRLAPSSYGLQPWKFFVVQNTEVKKQLREVSWGQSIIEECSHLIVLATMKTMSKEHIEKHVKNTTQLRGLPAMALEGYQKFMEQGILSRQPEDLMAWNKRQAYIALGFLLETAALLKIDSTPVEGFEPEKYDKILGLDKMGYTSAVVASLGYRHPEDAYQSAAKSRFKSEELFQEIK